MAIKETQQGFASISAISSTDNLVETLLNTYRQSTYKRNSERIGREDTLSEFIPSKILDQIREIGSAKAIRVYFGRFPDDFPDTNLAGRQSVVFTARF